MSQEEAVAQLQERYKSEVVGQILTLQYGEEDALQKWDIPFEDIGAGYHVEDAVKKAYETGRTRHGSGALSGRREIAEGWREY